MNEYNILILSNNVVSTTMNNGLTINRLINWKNPINIKQIYVQAEIPDCSVCSEYYRITDADVIRSVTTSKSDIGKIYSAESLDGVHSSDEGRIHSIDWVYNFVRQHNLQIFRLIRDIMWIVHMPRQSVLKFVKRRRVHIVLFQAGDSIFMYYIADIICSYMNIPCLLFITDDYILHRSSIDPIWWIRRKWIHKRIKRIVDRNHVALGICNRMCDVYGKLFSCRFLPVMNAVNKIQKSVESKVENCDGIFHIGYFGGLHTQRWISILRLASELKKNSKYDFIRIHIYTFSSIPSKMQKYVESSKNLVIESPVDQNGLLYEMRKMNSLLHVESFSKRSIEATQLSMSTKIPEYLASGVPLLCIGPKNISSIEYICNNHAGIIVNKVNKENIDSMVLRLLDQNERDKCLRNARHLVESNHFIENNQRVVREAICSLLK